LIKHVDEEAAIPVAITRNRSFPAFRSIACSSWNSLEGVDCGETAFFK